MKKIVQFCKDVIWKNQVILFWLKQVGFFWAPTVHYITLHSNFFPLKKKNYENQKKTQNRINIECIYYEL